MVFWEKFMYHQNTLKIFSHQYVDMFAVLPELDGKKELLVTFQRAHVIAFWLNLKFEFRFLLNYIPCWTCSDVGRCTPTYAEATPRCRLLPS